MPSCQTCSSDLRPSQVSLAYLPPCCAVPICERCISLNPRLSEYTPCLRCGDPRTEELAGGSTLFESDSGSGRDGTRGAEQVRQVGTGAEVVFEIGDDDEDLPPAYDEAVPNPVVASDSSILDQVNSSSHRTGGDTQEDQAKRASPPLARRDPVPQETEGQYETVEVRHPLRRGENLLAIARKYAADPHEILSLNNLPYTTLSSHPHLLRTRTSLLISRRQIPRSQSIPLSQLTLDTDTDTKKPTSLTAEESEKREKERQVKRFQLLTKTLDRGVASAYLALEEMREPAGCAGVSDSHSDAPHPLELGSGEAVPSEKEFGGGKKAFPMPMPDRENREDRALNRFWEDEEWERANGPFRQRHASGSGMAVGRWNVGAGGRVKS